ncbi:NmrA family NAD(P)-binding protein [Micromonospora sp. C28SCA-DRY-2]|uniref:NmrA family NAD(P)-binding protein n=1 Tax=Micromonospora sp. C28SCA-DRY-2 TaxID=3059522 RepID=UPI00267506DD|nr:NmrA family NAD(P)-binding protein [Micromonospora sp. C28SCA-DRY-2]MDO3702640.1 NmrA family NAD(P)-binding protein [Micromonospora sp. C28SCA-DRY-2]
MTYIVHGATGAQGSPVLAALRAAGKRAIAAVRHTGDLADRGDAVAVDLADAESLTAAYTGADGVFVHLPLGAPGQGSAQAEAVAAAVATARPQRVVISTSGQIVDQPGTLLQAADDSPIVTLIRKVTDTGVSTAVVTPRLYLENLLLPVVAGPAREDGVLRYPLPEVFPVSWSSHLDVAEVVVRLLTDTSVTGTVAVGHLPGLTGPDLATAFAEHLGRDVRFEAITPDMFGDLITPMFGPAAAPVVGLYQALNTQNGNTIGEDNSAQKALGLFPRPVTRWLADLGV